MTVTEPVVGAFEAKTHLSELLARVEAGESITITKHGRPVARLVPVEAQPQRDWTAFWSRIDERRARMAAEGFTTSHDEIRALIAEGRV